MRPHKLSFLISVLLLAVTISSCNNNSDSNDQQNKPTGNIVPAPDESGIIRTETMDSNKFEMVQGYDTITTLNYSAYYHGFRPVRMNGQTIFTTADSNAEPTLTDAGYKKVTDIKAVLHKRLPTISTKYDLTFIDLVINEKGKVVFFICEPIAVDSTATNKDLEMVNTKARPLIDSLQPLLLSITFEPLTVNGTHVPFLVRNFAIK